MFRRISLVAALLAVALAATACGGGGSQQSATTAPASSSSAGEGVQRIEVVLSDFKFEPATITVQRGTPVEIVMRNTGTVPHDFNVDDLSLSSGQIQAGQSGTLQFTPNRAGEFRIVCHEAGHEALGMVGTLIVQ